MPNPFRTANPALNEKAFQGQVAVGEAMTVQGTVNKTGLLLLVVVATSAWTWGLSIRKSRRRRPLDDGRVFGGLIPALVTVFKKTWAPFTAPLYALLEGLVLGGISALFEKSYPGIALQAMGLTFGVLFVYAARVQDRLIRRRRL